MTNKEQIIYAIQKNIDDTEWDKHFEGLFSAFKSDNRVLSREKFLYDQVLGLLSQVELKNEPQIEKYLKYVKQWLKDGIKSSLIKEEYGTNIDMGLFKDSEIWYEIAVMLKYCAIKLSDEELNHIADQISEDIEEHLYVPKMHSYKAKVSSDFRMSVDGMLNNTTTIVAALFMYLKYKNHQNNGNLNKLLSRMKQIRSLMTNDQFFVSRVNLDGSLNMHSKITLKGQCLTTLLFYLVGKTTSNHTFTSIAKDIASYTNQRFWDKKYHGYFSFIDSDEKITIHKEYVALLTEKTPAKLSFDNALMLFTLNFIKWNTLSKKQEQRFNNALHYFMSLYDDRNAGFFIGEGYFWAAPGIPVGPFLRSVAPTPETPGVFNLGTKKFLNFYYKFPKSQSMSLIALNSIPDRLFIVHKRDQESKTEVDNVSFSDINYHPLHEKKVDLTKFLNVQKHLEWIHNSYTLHQTFGWTPYEAPLNIKSDKTSSVFGAQHALANLLILGGEIPYKDEMANWIRNTQSQSGAFCETPGGPEDVLDTYLSIDALSMLGKLNIINREQCIKYLQSCQNSDGGFGINPGYKSDMFHSNLALAALYLLDSHPLSDKKLIDYTLSTQQYDGGFAEYYIGTSDTYSCFRAVSTFNIYGLKIPNVDHLIKFLQNCQNSDGGFAQDSEGTSSLIATYHAVASLFMLHSAPKDIENCLTFLSKCQTPDGGISNIPGKSTGTIDEGFAGIQSLAILTNQLDQGFVALNS